MTTPAAPTDPEIRLVEQYVRVLDFVSRCAQAIDTGNWHYLWAKTAQLEDAAGWLGSPTRPGSRSAPAGRGPAPRSSVPRSPTRAATTWPVGCCTLPTPGPPRQGVSGHDRPAASGLLGGRGLGPLLRLGQREPLRRLPAQPHRAV